jgi:WD40 repeat protein
MKVFDQDSNLLQTIQSHTQWINRMKQSPFNSAYLATASWDAQVKIWEISNNQLTLIRTNTYHSSWVEGLEFIDTDTIISCSLDETIQIWSISTGNTKKVINAGLGVISVKLLIDRVYLAAGLFYGSIKIFNVNTGSLIATLQGHTNNVVNLETIGKNGDLLASSSDDSFIRVWNLTTFTCKFVLQGHTSTVYGLVSVSSDILASGSLDSTIKFWDINTGNLLNTLTGHTNGIYWSIDLLNDGKTLVSGSCDGTIKLWDWEKKECLNTIQAGGTCISAMAVLNKFKSKQLNFRVKYILNT